MKLPHIEISDTMRLGLAARAIPGARATITSAVRFEEAIQKVQAVTGRPEGDVMAEVLRRQRDDPAAQRSMLLAAEQLYRDATSGEWPGRPALDG